MVIIGARPIFIEEPCGEVLSKAGCPGPTEGLAPYSAARAPLSLCKCVQSLLKHQLNPFPSALGLEMEFPAL